MSSSNCCFLTCIQVSQEAGQVVWYSHLFQNFSQFIVIPVEKKNFCFADKGAYIQSYGFSSSRVWMWELDHKEGWAPKNLCFQIMVLEETLESPLDCK